MSKTTQATPKKSIYLSASFITERETVIINTTPTLDLALGGGIPEGTTVICTSQPKIGKTTLGFQCIADAQKKGKVGVIVAVEERIVNLKKVLTGIKGLDLSEEKLKIICSQEGDILSAEDYLQRAEQALIDFPGCFMVFDSFSALSPSNELTNNYSDQTMGGTGKLQAKFCRRTQGLINVNRCTLFGIVHKAPNLTGYGGPTDNMGEKVKYKLDARLQIKKAQPFEWMSGDEQVGQRVEVEVMESALGSPGKKATLWLRYGEGYSAEAEIIDLAAEMGIIEKKGAGWHNLPNGEKVQGWDNVYQALQQNNQLYLDIEKKVKEMLL